MLVDARDVTLLAAGSTCMAHTCGLYLLCAQFGNLAASQRCNLLRLQQKKNPNNGTFWRRATFSIVGHSAITVSWVDGPQMERKTAGSAGREGNPSPVSPGSIISASTKRWQADSAEFFSDSIEIDRRESGAASAPGRYN